MDFYIYCLFLASFALFIFSILYFLIGPYDRVRSILGFIVQYILSIGVVLLIVIVVPDFYCLIYGNNHSLIGYSIVCLLISALNFRKSNVDATVVNIPISQKYVFVYSELLGMMLLIALLFKILR